jgi:hypothetical protein
MSKLIEALKKKFKSPYEVIEALGLDASLLKSAVVGDQSIKQDEKEQSMARFKRIPQRVRLAYDTVAAYEDTEAYEPARAKRGRSSGF